MDIVDISTSTAAAIRRAPTGLGAPARQVSAKAGAAALSGGRDKVTISAEASRMKQAEEKVKSHEAAHQAAGGQLAGPATYHYKTGPDGKSYIAGGEVQIDVSPGKTPQETVAKMEQVKRAALAPADPSPQDRAVAAQATAQEQQARSQLQKGEPSSADHKIEVTSGPTTAGDAGTAANATAPASQDPAEAVFSAIASISLFA